jgi:tRNA1Val (adenine37-N6)-methyltransferase
MKNTSKRQGFQCKQFFVAHDQCAMKVGTDSLILGSWCDVSSSKHILDIGTGSGILSIMLAQKSNSAAQIIGIDIDRLAISQACGNASESDWQEKLSFVHADVSTYTAPIEFDCIISNPPYFEVSTGRSIKMEEGRRQARHVSTLTYEKLINAVSKSLSDKGLFYMILPHESVGYIETVAVASGLVCLKRLKVRSKQNKPFIRQCLCFGYGPLEKEAEATLTIYNENGQYTTAYRRLCKDYYLSF